MRLAVFTNQFPGKVTTFFARDMRALLECGIEVDVYPIYPLTRSFWKYVPKILDERALSRNKIHHIGMCRSLASLIRWPDSKLAGLLHDGSSISVSAAKFGVVPLLKSLYVLPKAWAWAHSSSRDYDHVLGYWGNYAATCAYAYHRLIDRPIPFSIFLHAGADLYHRQTFLREKLLYADNIITCNEFNRQFLKHLYPDIFDVIEKKLHIYHHGLDPAEFPFEPDGRPPHKVIAVGRFVKTKGFDILLRAVHQLVRQGSKIELELIGDGVEAGTLKSLTGKLGIRDRVNFRGFLRADEIRAAMRQATILVHPSNGAGDGLPNVIKESIALGTPVIASDLAGIAEGLDRGRCGVLVPPGDVSALATAMEKLLGNPAMCQQFAETARPFAEKKFDLWRNGRDLAKLLNSSKRQSACNGETSTPGWPPQKLERTA
jgi:glycosyltransferase involved in cell wall biosynthesis